MALRVNEVGKTFVYATYFELSLNSSLELHFQGPGGETTVKTSPDVTAPGIGISGSDSTIGALEAGTYMQFLTELGDFPIKGEWTVCGVYVDGTPKRFIGSKPSFTVEEGC